MEKCPKNYKKPEFVCSSGELTDWSGIDIKFVIGEDDYKYDTECYIDVDANYSGGYDMGLAVKMNNDWHWAEEVQAIRLVIRGSYEREAFITSLQKVGLMVLPVYGKIRDIPEEQHNALQESSRP